MKIEIFPSGSGDCLLITSADGGKRILADAGLPEAYDAHIAKPLSKLRAQGKPIDVAYVSHIDRDHIGGILRMFDDEVKWRAFEHVSQRNSRLRAPTVPRPPEVSEIWHNAFLEDVAATEEVDLGSALATAAQALAGRNAALADPSIAADVAAVEMLALSVGDAIEVNWRISPEQLRIPLNPQFGGKLMTARRQAIQVGSFAVTVLGPTAKQLSELRTEWIEWLRKRQAQLEKLRRRHQRDEDLLASGASPADLAAHSRELAGAIEKDVTPPNLASLVLLVEEGGKRVLLTGDAGVRTLIEYLESAKLLGDDDVLEVEVLKVPHHGAKNSYSEEFARRVRAEHYVFCGDGEHHNPEPDVVRGYIEAVRAAPLSGGRRTTFWFNWSLARATEHRSLWEDIESMFSGRDAPPSVRRRSLRAGQTRLVLQP